jgi:uncharacterized protein DUF397
VEFGHAQWHKSSYSAEGADCIEIAYPTWRKSSHSAEGEACIEVAYPASASRVGIRDSKNPASGHLTLRDTALHHLVATCSTS